MSIQQAEVSKQVPLMIDEMDMDLLHQALNHFAEHLKDLGVDLSEVENLQERIAEAEDRLIEEGAE